MDIYINIYQAKQRQLVKKDTYMIQRNTTLIQVIIKINTTTSHIYITIIYINNNKWIDMYVHIQQQ